MKRKMTFIEKTVEGAQAECRRLFFEEKQIMTIE